MGVLNSLQEVLKCEWEYMLFTHFVLIDNTRLSWLCILSLPHLYVGSCSCIIAPHVCSPGEITDKENVFAAHICEDFDSGCKLSSTIYFPCDLDKLLYHAKC